MADARTAACAALTALVVLAGCSGSSGDSAGATSSTTAVVVAPTAPPSTVRASSAAATTHPPSTVAATVASTAPAVVELPDPMSLLQQALAGVDAGYHFETEVVVGDSVVLTLAGDQVGDGTRLAVTSNGKTVDYVVTPDGAWAGQDGAWQELAQDAPVVSDPLQPLATPTSLEVSTYDGHHATLTGAYPAVALGLAGDQPVSVGIDIVDGTLVGLSYTAAGDGASSQVHTSVTPLVDTSPVTVPSG